MAAVEDEPSNSELKRGQDRIESAVGSLAESFAQLKDSLSQQFMPRPELVSTFSTIRDHQLAQDSRLLALETGRETDRNAVTVRMDASEERHRTDRTNGKIAVLMILGLLLTLTSIIVTHWK